MKKAKWFLLALGGTAILCLVMALFFEKAQYQDVIEPAKIVDYEGADAVIADSVLIVRVKKTSETPITYSLEGGLQDCFTLSVVKVEEIFKNSGNSPISEGSELDILESQWTDKENRIIHHTEGYLKMETGKQYYLLLGQNPSVSNYYPVGLLYGKIPVDPDERLFLGEGYEQVKNVIEDLRQIF